MAEALGIAAGIAGLVSLTIEVSGISYKYVKGVRNSSSSKRQFLKELEDLQEVLSLVERLTEDVNEAEVFGEAGSCLLSIKKSNEYILLLQEIRDKLQQPQTSSSIRNGVRALTWPFSEKETLHMNESLHRHLEIYNTAMTVDNLTIGGLALNEVRQINISHADSQIEAALDWLSPLNMYKKQQDTLSRRHGITGSWLLDDPVFRSWVNEEYSQRTLWCPGDPGTGKTIITSVVVDYLLNNHANEDIKVAYVYCDYKDQAAQTASNLVACLVRHIIERPKVLPQQLTALHEEVKQQNRRPSFDELKRLLVALCNQHVRTYILLDALDECEAIRERRILLPMLESLPNAPVRLFVTSRPNNEDIFEIFGKASQVTIAAPELDLRRYTIERMDERKEFANKLDLELKEKITSTISAQASGMFLLAALQIDRIFATRTTKAIKSALASMPRELDELYRQTLERIHKQAGDDGTLGMRILGWITHAKRPLSVNELRHGLAIEYNDDEGDPKEFDEDNLLSPKSLVDVCAGLVIIDKTSQVIRLVHYTTQEYFDKARQHLFRDADVDISRACLTYLSYDIFTDIVTEHSTEENLSEVSQSHPFLNYSSHNWFSHVKSVLLTETPDPALLKVLTLFKSSDSISICTAILKLSHKWRFSLLRLDQKWTRSPLECGSDLGLEELVTVLLDHSTGPCSGLDSSFLVFASYRGHLNVVKLLLQNGAAIDSTVHGGIFESLGRRISALNAACFRDYVSVAEFLIENGADIHGSNDTVWPPIVVAAMMTSPIIIDLLLNKGSYVNARAPSGRTACHWAAVYGNIDSVRRLLDADCDLDLTDDDGDTVLHSATFGGNLDVIELLLDKGADASAKNKKGETARHILERGKSMVFPPPGYREGSERIIERLLQLERKSSAPATKDATKTKGVPQ